MAVLLTASDLQPLRDDPAYMDGALTAVETAIVAQSQGKLRQHRMVDRVEGEFEGIRVSLLAGEDTLSGMRVFGNPPHTRAFLMFDGVTRALLALMDYGILNSLRVGATAGVAARGGLPWFGLAGAATGIRAQISAARAGAHPRL
jgi:ornithine cyclodeaminase/alanine dehydrogenase-like protein (mu-crystallin family)